MFLAHSMTPFYPKYLSLYPKELADLLLRCWRWRWKVKGEQKDERTGRGRRGAAGWRWSTARWSERERQG
ncbi:hypothetical protein SOVF_014330 [Spinacia oleracea]|nr:hypothetical protein SOVF_014330 [Spinacia oleracea]